MKSKITNVAITAALELLGLAAIYLLISFVLWIWNPAEWSDDARFLAAMFTVLLSIAVISSHSIREMK